MLKYNCLFLLLSFYFGVSQNSIEATYDSIYKYRDLIEYDTGNTTLRKTYLRKLIRYSKQTKCDSTISRSNMLRIYHHYFAGELEKTKLFSQQNISLSQKSNDYRSEAYSYHVLGDLYYFDRAIDSAYAYYSKALAKYQIIKKYKKQALLLISIAGIQEEKKDYVGAENKAIKASLLMERQPIEEEDLTTLFEIYNLLGITSSALKQYDNAVSFYEKAIRFSEQIEDKSCYFTAKGNLLLVYTERKEFNKAILGYNDFLQNNLLKTTDSSTYSYAVLNLAHAKSLSKDIDVTGTYKMFHRALRASSEQNDFKFQAASYSYYADFLIDKDEDSALYYADLTYKTAKKFNYTDYILESIMTKSKIVKDSSAYFLNSYIKINDSLLSIERNERNKFLKIKYQTNTVIEENKKMTQERLWLIIALIASLVTFFLLYVNNIQRQKNKGLVLYQKQQEANQEIYNLLLDQHEKIDQARGLEKNRISKDIHDGILGKLFGVRLSLDSLNYSTENKAPDLRSNYINELKNIEDDIRKVSHNLNVDFIRQAGYLDVVESLIETQMLAYGLEHSFKTDYSIDWENLNSALKIQLYRILQETMQNVYKHADASFVTILFSLNNNSLMLEVLDNGKGFSLNKVSKGIGLKNIASRIKEVKGILNIETKINKGTKIVVTVPV